MGGDGFQLRMERKGRELNLGAAIVRATETVLPSSGPAVCEGTDGLREILVLFEGLESLSASQTLSFSSGATGMLRDNPTSLKATSPTRPSGHLPSLQPQQG